MVHLNILSHFTDFSWCHGLLRSFRISSSISGFAYSKFFFNNSLEGIEALYGLGFFELQQIEKMFGHFGHLKQHTLTQSHTMDFQSEPLTLCTMFQCGYISLCFIEFHSIFHHFQFKATFMFAHNTLSCCMVVITQCKAQSWDSKWH
jgi:hypothetical protein